MLQLTRYCNVEVRELAMDYTLERLVEIYRAVASGEGKHGGFLVSFAETFVHADQQNAAIMRTAAITLINKYGLDSYGKSGLTYIDIEESSET